MRGIVDIRPGEGRPIACAFFSLLGITAGHTLLETARDALFLAKLPASRLPWMYLAIAGIGLALARINRGRAKKSQGRYAVSVSLLAAAGITLGFWAASSWKGTWFLYALYVWTGIFASWVIVQFWLLLGSLFTVAQAKRIFGFIGAGSVLGAVSGAALARGLAGVLPAQHLLVGAAGMLILTGLGPALLLRPPEEAERTAGHTAGKGSIADDLRLVGGDPYVKRILALVLLSTVALTTVDYLFKAAIAARIPPGQLGAFFANVYVVLNALALVVQVGAVGWMLRTFGVHRALWVMPVLMVAGSAGVLAGGGLAAALMLKGADGTLRHSLHRTSTELLYVPIPDTIRGRAKPFIDLVGQRGGQAVASLGILALVEIHVGEKGLAIAVAVLAAGWILVAAGIRQHYLDVFRSTLRAGRVDYQGDLPELDLGALEALFSALNSSKDPEVIGALDLLAAQKRHRLIPALILYHPSRTIVLRALEIFTREGRTDFIPIAERLLSHADPEVRAAALRARTAVLPDESFLRDRLADERLEVRATAVVGLVARGWMEGKEAKSMLEALASDPAPAVRIALARAIGQEPSPKFEATLLSVIACPESEVKQEAALAMGRVGSERFLPVLLPMIALRELGQAAREALAGIGEPALARLDEAVEDTSLDRAIRWNAPRAIAMFEPSRAAPILIAHLGTATDGMVRFRILRALSALRVEDPTLDLDDKVLTRAAEETMRTAFRCLDWRLSLENGKAEASHDTGARELLVTLLKDKETHATARLFRVLGLLHPGENFERIHRGLLKKDPKTRASSRELIENLVSPALRAAIVALVEDVPDAQRLERAAPWYRAERLGYDDLLRKMLDRGREVGSLARYHAAEIGLSVSPTVPPAAPKEEGALSAGLAAARLLHPRPAHA